MSLSDWIAIAGGVVGVAVAYLLYVKTFSSKGMSYRATGVTLINPKNSLLPEKVKIFFADKPVSSLSKVNYIIWNSGRGTVLGEDIRVERGLSIAFPEGAEILEVNLEKVSRPVANQVRVEVASSQMLWCRFDLLERGEGLNLAILHTGMVSPPAPEAVIAGIPGGITAVTQKRGKIYKLIGGLSLMTLVLLASYLPKHYGWPEPIGFISFMVILFGGIFTLGGLFDRLSRPEPRLLSSNR